MPEYFVSGLKVTERTQRRSIHIKQVGQASVAR